MANYHGLEDYKNIYKHYPDAILLANDLYKFPNKGKALYKSCVICSTKSKPTIIRKSYFSQHIQTATHIMADILKNKQEFGISGDYSA